MKSEFDAMWSLKGGKEDVCKTICRAFSSPLDMYSNVDEYKLMTKAELKELWRQI